MSLSQRHLPLLPALTASPSWNRAALPSMWSLALCLCLTGFWGCTADPIQADGPEVDAETEVISGDASIAETRLDAAVDEGPRFEVLQPVFCEGPVGYVYAPIEGEDFTTFPDDYYTEDAPETRTGLRLRFDPDHAPWIETSVPTTVASVFDQLGTLDGFGTTAGVTLRFDDLIGEALPSGAIDSVASSTLMLVDLGPVDQEQPQPAVRVPFEVQYTDEGTTAILWPMRPLRPKHRHVAVLTRDHEPPGGGCVAPSPTLQAFLSGDTTEPGVQRLVPRYRQALEQAGVAVDDVSAAVVFTTQSIVEDSVAIAEAIQAFPQPSWSKTPVCTPGPDFQTCEGAFVARDFRDADGVLRDTDPEGSYELLVTLYLPNEPVAGGAPMMVYGHGLGGSRHQAEQLAELSVPMGFAAVAIDAPHHGDHPGPEAPGVGFGEPLDTLVGFFGFITEPDLGVDGLVLRDNWRQSTYDKLQLVRLLRAQPDLDGDGQPELDPTAMVYTGASLGAIMGSELLALTDAFGAGILMVGGARVASIIQEAEQFQIIITIMNPGGSASDGEVQRFFPVLQTLIDAGDPANYAPHVLRDRFVQGSGAPHLLLTHAAGDDTVPPGTNRALARAFQADLTHVPPAVYEVGLIATSSSAPVSGNTVDDQGGPLTAGLFQYDRIRKTSGAEVKLAKHGNVPASFESFTQIDHFLSTWLATGVPEIVDPYAVTGTGPLP